jgi:hypothetical protein
MKHIKNLNYYRQTLSKISNIVKIDNKAKRLDYSRLLNIFALSLFSFTLIACSKVNKPNELDEPSFMVSTLPVSTQGNVEKNLGYYCRIFSFTDIKNYGAQLDATVKSIIEAGKQQGANGLLGLQFSNININNNLNNIEHNTASQPEIQNPSSTLMQVCGDMVVIAKPS